MYDVFISYSRRDMKTAEAICDALSAAGMTFFIDKEGISPGANFPEVLAKNIDDSTVFLLLAGENSYKSKFTKAEILYAFNHKRSGCIIPYILDDTDMPADLEFLLGNVNWVYSSKVPVDGLPAEIKKALDNPDSGTIAGRKVRKPWFLWILLPLLVAAVGFMVWQSRQEKSVKDEALKDYAVYEQAISAADSLISCAGQLAGDPDIYGTTARQMELLGQASASLNASDSIRTAYAGGEHMGLFNKDIAPLRRIIESKIDSIYNAWAGFAMDSYNLYRITGSESEAEYALECIDQALSIKPSPELEALRDKLSK